MTSSRAERILESQHYGLHHVKERILEYLAVRTLCSVQTSQILVVDDEEIARTNLEYILRKEGHQVATAANGLEALEKFKAQEFDVVLTDLKMEKMDGIQLLESVKQIAPTHGNRHDHRLRHGELRGGRPEKGRRPLPIQAHQAR